MKEVEGYLASIVESSADAVTSTDLNGVLTFWNKGAEDIFGYEAKEIVGEHYYKIVPKELWRETEELRKKVLKKGYIRNYETYRLHKSGEKIPVNLTISVIKDRDGKIIGTSGVFKDLSEKKKLEQEVKETKDYLQKIIDISPICIISTDLKGKILSFNKSAEKVYGYRAREVIGRNIRILQPKEIPQKLKKEIYTAMLKKEVWEGELDNVRKNGEVFSVYLLTKRIRQKNKPTGLISLALDITEGKRLADEIKKTKDYLQGVIEASADAIVTTSIDGKILSWSKGAEEIYGYAAKEVVGKQVFEIYPPELRKERTAWVNALLRGRVIRNKRTRIYNREGKLVDISLSLSLLRDEKGSPIATVGVSKNISREVRLEQKLEEHIQKLEETNKEVENFVYAISHDLKSPLISIQGFISALISEHGEKLDEQGKFYLERINKNSGLIDDLITDLLELSRIGRTTRPFEKVNAAEVVKETCDEFSHRFKNIKFRVKKLPVIYCEKNRIIQLFNNLIENSIKYMGTPEEPFVEIGCADAGGEWQFYVKDNGIGIPKEYQSKLFKPFQRIPSEKTRDVKGTGLGLAIVNKIVDYHKGRVWVESGEGKGSTFYFTMPK
jgi:PAS domain S-box-containing protein